MRCVIFTAIRALVVEIRCNVGQDAGITASAMPQCGELRTGESPRGSGGLAIYIYKKKNRGFQTRRFAVAYPCPSFPWFFWIPWLILSKEFPWLFVFFLCFFQAFSGFGGGQKSLVNLRFFLGKTEKPRKGRTGLMVFSASAKYHSDLEDR